MTPTCLYLCLFLCLYLGRGLVPSFCLFLVPLPFRGRNKHNDHRHDLPFVPPVCSNPFQAGPQ